MISFVLKKKFFFFEYLQLNRPWMRGFEDFKLFGPPVSSFAFSPFVPGRHALEMETLSDADVIANITSAIKQFTGLDAPAPLKMFRYVVWTTKGLCFGGLSSLGSEVFPLWDQWFFLFGISGVSSLGPVVFPLWIRWCFLFGINGVSSLDSVVFPLWDRWFFLFGIGGFSSLGSVVFPLWIGVVFDRMHRFFSVFFLE